MIIDLDMGNSRLKWRSSVSPSEIHAHSSEDELFSHWRTLVGVTRVRVAAVVAAKRIEAVSAWCRLEWQVQIELAVVTNNLGGLRVAYEDVASLGVDRWLSMHAARRQFGDIDMVVVSAGTALTVDYLAANGKHLGGYIFPGWRAGVSGLLSGTSRIQVSDLKLGAHWQPGVSTKECLEAGIALTYRTLVHGVAQIKLPNFAATRMVLTGGDADVLLESLLGIDLIVGINPALVLQGLSVVLP